MDRWRGEKRGKPGITPNLGNKSVTGLRQAKRAERQKKWGTRYPHGMGTGRVRNSLQDRAEEKSWTKKAPEKGADRVEEMDEPEKRRGGNN